MMLVNAAVTRLGRASAVALLVAAAGGVGLIVAAFLAPMYATMSASSSGELTHGTDTLVGVNGLGVLVVIGVPLVATLAVGGALWHGSRRGAVPLAWMLAGLLAVFNMLAMLSVGVFFLPVTAALIIACATYRPLQNVQRQPSTRRLPPRSAL
jgi:thiol:disulfide interchange protein